uniref:Cell division protein FtsX n=1 Tax=candidate division WOR-3 bacterium TaxID=2052148 RepID=A0A7C4TIQ2_UNCW3
MALGIGVREGIRTIVRNSSLFILSLLVVAISFFLLSLFALLTINLYSLVKGLEGKIEIIAFLDEHADVEMLHSNILRITGVSEVIYVSSETALKELQEEMGETKEVLRVFEDNPLPASLRIKLAPEFRNSKGLKELSEKITLLKGVKETIYGGELVDQLKGVTKIITYFDAGLLMIITLAVIFVTFQTIKLTIFARSTEIEIMKLVGAEDSLISIPFIFQGMIQGLLGGFIAFVLLLITAKVGSAFFSIPYFPKLFLLVGNLFFGMIFGIIGSAIALRRFLK